MNVALVLELADIIESNRYNMRFDMSSTDNDIIGHVHKMAKEKGLRRTPDGSYLGLDEEVKAALIMPPDYQKFYKDDGSTIRYSRAQCAKVIRHLAHTGIVDWEI
jgi:hypothetical protein